MAQIFLGMASNHSCSTCDLEAGPTAGLGSAVNHPVWLRGHGCEAGTLAASRVLRSSVRSSHQPLCCPLSWVWGRGGDRGVTLFPAGESKPLNLRYHLRKEPTASTQSTPQNPWSVPVHTPVKHGWTRSPTVYRCGNVGSLSRRCCPPHSAEHPDSMVPEKNLQFWVSSRNSVHFWKPCPEFPEQP